MNPNWISQNTNLKEVTEEELRQLFIEDGKDDPTLQIILCKTLGSSVLIGNTRYQLKRED